MNLAFKKATFFAVACFLMFLIACTNQNGNDMDNQSKTTLRQELLMDTSFIHWHGRTHYDDEEGAVFFYHTASGFTITFNGTQLKATLLTSSLLDEENPPYLCVMVDNESPNECTSIILDELSDEYILAEGLENGLHTVTLLKKSESQDALTSLKSLVTDGTFLSPSVNFESNILFIGGSGISGNGVFGNAFETRTTENSSSIHAFGYKVADQINADFQFVAGSGWGLKWGFNETNNDGEVNIRTAFDVVGINQFEELIPIEYNPDLFIPNFIVINIGGNDYNAHIRNFTGEAYTNAEETFRDSVIEMINHLHTQYPNAYIIWTHTGSLNGAIASGAISDLDPLGRYIESLEIYSPGSFNDPKGSGNHAGELTHERNAKMIVEAIETKINDAGS